MKNLVAFVEIPAVDFGRAVKFYESVLGIELSVMDCGDVEKMAFFPREAGKCPGAISFASDFKPSKDGVLVSLSVENMDKTLSIIENNGGRIIRSKTKIEAEGMGYFALFIDCEGNRAGLYSDK